MMEFKRIESSHIILGFIIFQFDIDRKLIRKIIVHVFFSKLSYLRKTKHDIYEKELTQGIARIYSLYFSSKANNPFALYIFEPIIALY